MKFFYWSWRAPDVWNIYRKASNFILSWPMGNDIEICTLSNKLRCFSIDELVKTLFNIRRFEVGEDPLDKVSKLRSTSIWPQTSCLLQDYPVSVASRLNVLTRECSAEEWKTKEDDTMVAQFFYAFPQNSDVGNSIQFRCEPDHNMWNLCTFPESRRFLHLSLYLSLSFFLPLFDIFCLQSPGNEETFPKTAIHVQRIYSLTHPLTQSATQSKIRILDSKVSNTHNISHDQGRK